MDKMIASALQISVRTAQNLGPYLLLELLMPGGTLLALLLYLYRRKGVGAESVADEAMRALRAVADTAGPAVGDVCRILGLHPAPVAARAQGRKRDGLEPLAMAPGA